MSETGESLLIETGIGETRVARVGREGPEQFKIFRDEDGSMVGRLYHARVKTILGELNAAVLDLGKDGEALLPFGKARGLAPQKNPKTIRHCVVEGGLYLVEIIRNRDVMDDKLPVASARAGLHGRYVRLEANGHGVTFLQKHRDKDLMEEIHSIADAFASHMAITIKPAAFEAPEEAFIAEIESLAQGLDDLIDQMKEPGLAVEQASVTERIITELANGDLDEVVFDDAAAFAEARDLARDYWPDLEPLLRRADSDERLMEDYGVEPMLEAVMDGKLAIGQGAYITIEHSKAATLIDVNTGNAHKSQWGNKAFEHVNVQAAKAVTRLLRFQNIGGIIIIDFIDTKDGGAISKLLKSVDRGIKQDHAPVERTGLSRFGIMQLKRQKRGPSLHDQMMQEKEPAVSSAFLAYELLRMGKRTGLGGAPGDLQLKAPAAVIEWLEERPGLITNLSERSARKVTLKISDALNSNALQATLI